MSAIRRGEEIIPDLEGTPRNERDAQVARQRSCPYCGRFHAVYDEAVRAMDSMLWFKPCSMLNRTLQRLDREETVPGRSMNAAQRVKGWPGSSCPGRRSP